MPSHHLYPALTYPNKTLRWRHNDHDSVSNHQPHGCLLNRLFRRRSKKTSKFRVTGLCVGNSPGPVNYPHKGPVTRKMFPFDDAIMNFGRIISYRNIQTLGALFTNIDQTDLMPWIGNYKHGFLWDIITYLCPHINGSLVGPLLNLGHRWLITYHVKLCMALLIHTRMSCNIINGTRTDTIIDGNSLEAYVCHLHSDIAVVNDFSVVLDNGVSSKTRENERYFKASWAIFFTPLTNLNAFFTMQVIKNVFSHVWMCISLNKCFTKHLKPVSF